MTFSFSPEVLSYEAINKKAETFLKTYTSGLLPVNIEEIIELRFGINIIPFPRLLETFEVDGFTSKDLSSIYVDEDIYNKRPSRYRFTLAHEVGHIILHKDLIKEINPASVAEWEDFYLKVDEDSYSWVEYQAYSFAGLILVPRIPLLKDYAAAIAPLFDKIKKARAAGFGLSNDDSYNEYVIDSISQKLTPKYDVSIGVLKKRLFKEVAIGNLTIP